MKLICHLYCFPVIDFEYCCRKPKENSYKVHKYTIWIQKNTFKFSNNMYGKEGRVVINWTFVNYLSLDPYFLPTLKLLINLGNIIKNCTSLGLFLMLDERFVNLKIDNFNNLQPFKFETDQLSSNVHWILKKVTYLYTVWLFLLFFLVS